MRSIDQYIKELEKELTKKKQSIKTEEVGRVLEVKDGVAILEGLDNAFYGEIVDFENGESGFIIDLAEDTVGVVVLGDYLTIKAGSLVKGTGRILSLPVSNSILGKVVNPLGKPFDERVKIRAEKYYPIEKIAPSVVYRRPVSEPVQTGIKAVDSLIPIGRGQRELIIGDRSTGKTTIAVDSIINQRGKDMICIYCAIGQKNSSIASVIDILSKNGAMDYSVVVSASAADSVALQYLAPYSATAIAEFFMDQGKDVLVVYDDLTKHSWAYRQVSLVLRRPAGREAYPGDIFYLHSRLLERACRLDKKYGGGSITALPIIETQANDISAYIPTNVISITDGQIYLQSDLFNAGIRPAINVGQSRVGGAAQTPTIKSVSGKLRLELAQYNSLAAFAQFGSELDAATIKQLDRGKRLTEILKQPQFAPLTEDLEVLSIYSVTAGLMDDIPVESFLQFEKDMHDFAKKHYPGVLEALSKGEKPTELILKQIAKLVEEFKKRFK